MVDQTQEKEVEAMNFDQLVRLMKLFVGLVPTNLSKEGAEAVLTSGKLHREIQTKIFQSAGAKSTSQGAVALATLIMAIPNLLWEAFVFSMLWGWFVVELFGVVHIGFAGSMGVIFTTYFLIGFPKLGRGANDEQVLYQLVGRMLRGFVCLLVGAVIHWIV